MLPDEYAVGGRYRILRACERFGVDPRQAEEMNPRVLAEWMAYSEIRGQEEARMRGVIVANGRA